MNEQILTVVGNVATEPRLRGEEDRRCASFRLAVSRRRRDPLTGTWHDEDTHFFTVSCWDSLGENVAASVRLGDPVVVTGRLFARDWEKDGRRGTSLEVKAQTVGHDLGRGTATFRRVVRSRAATEERAEAGAGAGATGGDGAGGEGAGSGGTRQVDGALQVDEVTGEVLSGAA